MVSMGKKNVVVEMQGLVMWRYSQVDFFAFYHVGARHGEKVRIRMWKEEWQKYEA